LGLIEGVIETFDNILAALLETEFFHRLCDTRLAVDLEAVIKQPEA
jgi:hypothetical protein